jgi:DMSO/TMAO reductase YedYZ heme-binding membrane subunit
MTWATATASVVVGLMLSARAVRARTGPWFLDLHRFLGGISVVFLVAHVATLWADSYVDFGPRELFVPGASEWRSEAIAWGIIAAYLMIAVEVSSLLRSRIGKRLWRVVHFLSFVAMAGGSYHAWLAGSDVKNPVTWAIAGIGSLLVLGLIALRLQRKDPDDPGPSGVSDNRAILEEMRRRLEELPIPESTPQPQISVSPNAILPRRAPVSDSLLGSETAPVTAPPPEEPVGFDDDPFGAVPLTSPQPGLGDWVAPSAADPFASSPDPDPFHARSSTDGETWSDDGADLFENLTGDPFESLGVASTPDSDGFPELPRREEKRDLFSAAVESDTPADLRTNPFDPIRPTASVVEASPTRVGVPSDGPPPLPDAIDPLTGEPDEAAYTRWLKEWLSYAEQYGDEAPGDPSRV